MVKTLRITSIVAATAAVILLVLPVVYGVKPDPKIGEFLQAPGVAEKYAAKGRGPARDESQISPLVREATKFATYLNPPPPPPAPVAVATAAPAAAAPAPAAPVSAKFDLIGTSYFATHPELSLVLIDEPGKGLHWVRQGSSVAHLIIEQVKDGSVTVRDGQRTFEMTVKEVVERWRSLIKGAGGEQQPTPPTVQTSPAAAPGAAKTATRPDLAALRRARSGAKAVGGLPGQPALRPVGSGQEAAARPGEEPPSDVAPQPQLSIKDMIKQRLAGDANGSRISEEEARRMEELARTLEQLESAGAASPPKPGEPVEQADANTPQPDSSADSNKQ